MKRVAAQPKDLEMGQTKDLEGRSQKEVSLEARYELRIAAERKTQATLHRMHKDFLNSINAYALVLVLLATLTFIGFLQPPAGFQDSKDRNGRKNSFLLSETSMTFFILFNSSSFYLAVADLLLCVCSSLSPLTSIDNPKLGPGPAPAPPVGVHKTLQSELVATSELSQFVASTLFKLICVNVIFALSLVCCVAAFTAAGFVVTRTGNDSSGGNERIPVVVTSVVGVSFFSIFMVWLLRDTGRFVSRAISDKSLSRSLQNRAGLSQIQFRYLSAAADSTTH